MDETFGTTLTERSSGFSSAKRATRSRQIVTITASDDPHVAFVQKHLRDEMTVIDVALILEGRSLSYSLNGKGADVISDGILLNNVDAVWLRKPQPLEQINMPLSEDYKEFSLFAIKHFSQLLYGRFPDALWVSSYYSIERASDKLFQLEIAKKIGFNIPATLVTSSEEQAKKFIKHHKTVITKPIERRGLIKNGAFHFFYTNKINKRTDISGLHLAPAIFQEAVLEAVDVRVTVVGDKVFAASITGGSMDQSNSTVRDWRVTNHDDSAKYEAIELPASVARLCVLHVKEMGLCFGAIDLMRDKKGVYWFLENNPNGQWAFVEQATGLPIGRAIARLLESGRRRA